MVGHDNVLLQDKSRMLRRHFIPRVMNHEALSIELQFSTFDGGQDSAEQAVVILDADGDEVSSRLGVVVIGQSN